MLQYSQIFWHLNQAERNNSGITMGKSSVMKKEVSLLMILLLIAGSVFIFGSRVSFADSGQDSDDTSLEYNVIDFGADGTDAEDASSAFRNALDMASQSSGETITIFIPAGTYHLNKALRVWSNTYIKADPDATMLCDIDGSGNMIYGVHYDSDGSLCTGLGNTYSDCDQGLYNQTHDVTIDGGTWDRNCSSDVNAGLLTMIHSSGLTFRNATFKGSTNHLLTLSGSQDITIADCTFKNMIKYTGSDSSFWGSTSRSNKAAVKKRYAQLEAVHLDHINNNGESGKYPQDGTPCKNISITSCTFSNVGAGPGTHNVYINDKNKYENCGKGSGLVIRGCSFENIWGNMANFCSFIDSSLADVVSVSSTSAICKIVDGSAVISNVNLQGIDGDVGPPIYINGGSAVKLKDVTINGSPNSGGNNCLVYIDGSSTVTASGLTLTNGNTGKAALAVVNSSKLILGNSKVISSRQNAIYAKNAKGLKVTGTTVKATGNNGIAAMSSSNINLQTNKISSSTKNGIYLSACNKATINRNTITTSKLCGIYLLSSKYATITSNTIGASGKFGIYATGTSKKPTISAKIQKNTVKAKKSNYAIYLYGYCKSCIVSSNRVGGKGYKASTKYKVKASGNKRI